LTWYHARVVMKRSCIVLACLVAALAFGSACSSPRPSHPALSPTVAQQLLRYNTRAANHLKYIQSQDRSCVYQLTLPDQSNHPDSVEVDHIAFCSGRSDLKQFDARVEFQWNKAEHKWELVHFGS
jgi:hypothetical protein